MKKQTIMILVVICLLALPLAGCSGFHFVVGKGNIISKDYDFKDFKNIEISSAIQYEISQSLSYNVSVSAHENIFPYLDIYQSGSTLVVRMKPGSFSNTSAKATVTVPEIGRLNISGASKGTAKGFKSNNDLDIEVSGASQLDQDIEAGRTEINVSGASHISGHLVSQETRFEISGASRVELKGSCTTTYLNVSGASRFNSPDLILSNANAEVSGASHATINTPGVLNAEVTGASGLDYYGSPSLNKITVNGASSINKK